MLSNIQKLKDSVEGEVLQIPDTVVGAIEVMNGLHGTGKERTVSLEASGYDPLKVQQVVNTLVEFWE